MNGKVITNVRGIRQNDKPRQRERWPHSKDADIIINQATKDPAVVAVRGSTWRWSSSSKIRPSTRIGSLPLLSALYSVAASRRK
jgi:hypothetical protein